MISFSKKEIRCIRNSLYVLIASVKYDQIQSETTTFWSIAIRICSVGSIVSLLIAPFQNFFHLATTNRNNDIGSECYICRTTIDTLIYELNFYCPKLIESCTIWCSAAYIYKNHILHNILNFIYLTDDPFNSSATICNLKLYLLNRIPKWVMALLCIKCGIQMTTLTINLILHVSA